MQQLNSLPTAQYENVDKLKANPASINNLNYNVNTEREQNVEKVNVDQVIYEVQSILEKNPKLPRLTRGEIVELLENITVEDSENLQAQRGQKALLLVMPYTSNNSNANMEELFTKPPITKIIDSDQDDIQQVEDAPPPFKPLHPTKPEIHHFDEEKVHDQNIFSQLEQELQNSFTEEPKLKYSKRTTLSKPHELITTTKSIQHPIVRTTAKPLKRNQSTPKRRQQFKTTTAAITTKTITTTPRTTAALELITNAKLSETPKIRRRPLVTQKPLAIEEITYKPQVHPRRRTTSSPEHHPNHKYPDEDKIENNDSSNQAIRIINPPKFVPKATKKPEVPYKAMQTTNKEIEKPNETILESINIPENMKNIVKDIDTLVHQDSTQIHQILPNLQEVQIVTKPPLPLTSTTIPDVSEMADNLTPEMRELLMSFGLIPNPNYKPSPFKLKETHSNKEEAEITRDSYVSFKPLPPNAPTRAEMDELLSEFGLRDTNRESKAISTKTNNKNQFNFDMVPDSHKHILKEVGLDNDESLTKKEPEHVFKPKEKPNANPEELDRLEKLLDMIKQLEKLNGNVTEENLNQIDMKQLKDLVETFNKPESLDLKSAPNPLDFDSGLSKNEVKRQQSTTTTAAPSNPSLTDLEASFGGASETVTVALPETTTPKRTGFYYLVDWNSFLDIDNQKGKRVNLRFQPKVGDPRNFLSVSVP